MKISTFAVVAVFGISPVIGAQSYKKELPDSLLRHAKLHEAEAAAIAQKRMPKARIEAVELEREHGRLIYSYDMKIDGKSGTEEVNVDAASGKVTGVEHESAAQEKKETAAEKKPHEGMKP